MAAYQAFVPWPNSLTTVCFSTTGIATGIFARRLVVFIASLAALAVAAPQAAVIHVLHPSASLQSSQQRPLATPAGTLSGVVPYKLVASSPSLAPPLASTGHAARPLLVLTESLSPPPLVPAYSAPAGGGASDGRQLPSWSSIVVKPEDLQGGVSGVLHGLFGQDVSHVWVRGQKATWNVLHAALQAAGLPSGWLPFRPSWEDARLRAAIIALPVHHLPSAAAPATAEAAASAAKAASDEMTGAAEAAAAGALGDGIASPTLVVATPVRRLAAPAADHVLFVRR